MRLPILMTNKIVRRVYTHLFMILLIYFRIWTEFHKGLDLGLDLCVFSQDGHTHTHTHTLLKSEWLLNWMTHNCFSLSVFHGWPFQCLQTSLIWLSVPDWEGNGFVALTNLWQLFTQQSRSHIWGSIISTDRELKWQLHDVQSVYGNSETQLKVWHLSRRTPQLSDPSTMKSLSRV